MSFDPEKITFFAKTDARGQNLSFGIKARDRQRHMYIVGKTGMGKSTLLENMAVQDIQNGEGMAFIDPHGSAAELLLEYIPEHRINDVIYFAPFDLENPISFNVMEDVGHDKRHLVVSGLMSTFKKIWVDAWSARMEYILTNALLVLIEYPDTTLLSVNRIFNDKAYRTKVVDYCTDPAVKSFWVDEFANYTERFAAEALPAIQNKIGQFTGNPLIRNIIGQPNSSFDFRKCMDEKKIVIMNLSKGLVGETNANLLGSMLTTRIYLAAMSRADLPLAQMKVMPNFYFYVDEFQSFANATFANILSEARKYHLNLIIAHQYIEQMEEEVRDAVFGNVGTTISFRVGPFDAETLETVFTPRFLAADLVNLGFAQIYLTLMIDGIGSQPFSARTLDPIKPPAISYKDMVIAASRRNFTKPRLEVEKIVTDLHTPEKIEKKSPVVKPNPSPKPQAEVKPQPKEVSTPANSASVTPAPISPRNPEPSPRPTPAIARPIEHKPREDKPVHNKREERPQPPKPRTVPAAEVKRPAAPAPKPIPKVDDLRSILAKIAQSNQADTKKPVSDSPQTTPAKNNTSQSTFKKIESNITPLQAALSELKKVGNGNVPRELPPRPFPLPQPQPQPQPQPSAFTPTSVIIKTEAENLHSEIESVFANLDKQVPAKNQSPTPVHTEVPQAEITPTPTPTPTLTNNLDSKQLAKILRSGAPEKSPFR
ncbi:type IV secretion system DNA-binding domain-containing protein [Patescibacteria group bacterium]|nr:type IV secretion system DNA-binding domain-containing protein [Patescibacteria group bacterium]